MGNKINIEVRARKDEDADNLYRRFKRQMKKEGVLDELRDKDRYQKPSEIKHKIDVKHKKLKKFLRRSKDSKRLLTKKTTKDNER